ncbi:MAG: 2'-deoxycytidine 5'-triphosphate deaminase [Candidatus Puniceispirillaceae bacterium]
MNKADSVTIPDGILSSDQIRHAFATGYIQAHAELVDGQIQPASLDLRLSAKAWRVQTSFLPGAHATVAEKLQTLALHEIDLSDGAVLERGCVYLVELQEHLALPDTLTAIANPKSSTGRVDVFTRLITDGGIEFESVPAGYHGPLYAEISPRTFSVIVRPGTRLSQLRLRAGNGILDDEALGKLQDDTSLVKLAPGQSGKANISQGVGLSVNFEPEDETGLIGWRARKHAGLIDMDKPGLLPKTQFWEKVTTDDLVAGGLVLNPDEFYILASREYVCVPQDYAAEMSAYDTRAGEFRAHYAGFFDPGFGIGASGPVHTRAVLEVRSHDVPFLIEQDQIVCRLVYEHMSQSPDWLYGAAGSGSNYQAQSLKLAKYFI